MKLLHLITFLAACFGPILSHGAVIYDNMGPSPFMPGINTHSVNWSYNTNSGIGGARGIATPFSFTSSAYELSSVTLHMELGGNEDFPNLEFGIYADAGGFPSLTPVTSVAPNPTFITTERQMLTYSFPAGNVLAPSTQFWLVVQPRIFGVGSNEFNAAYSISTTRNSPSTTVAVKTLPAPLSSEWSPWSFFNAAPPAFRLEGIAVPEPSTWSLLGLGSALFWCATRRRRK